MALDLVDDGLVVLRGAALLDELHHGGHLLLGDEAALHAHGLPLPQRVVEHIPLAHQLLRAGGVQNDAGLQAGGDGKGDAAGDVRLHEARDHVRGGPLRGDNQVHTGGAPHLCHAADGLLHLLGRHQHEVGQLVNDHHDLRHGVLPLPAGVVVVGGQVLRPHLGKGAVALHHLVDGPLQRAGGLLRVRDHGNEQVRDAVVDAQLHDLRVHHDEADLVWRGLIEQGDDERVGTHRLAGPGGAGDEHMRQAGDVAHDAVARDVLAHGEGDLGRAVEKGAGAEDLPDAD